MHRLLIYLLFLLPFTTILSAQTCDTPLGLVNVGVTANSSGAVWQQIADAQSYTFEWRPAGTTNWTAAQTLNNNYNLLNLTICSTYEMRVRANCGVGLQSDFSEIVSFQTNCTPNCDAPFAQFASQITDTTAVLSWSPAGDSSVYLLRFRETGAATWTLFSLTEEQIALGDLNFCTRYEFQTAAICGTDTSSFGGLYHFKTYCGQCEAPTGIVSFGETQTQVNVVWRDAAGATGYAFRWREMGQLDWQVPTNLPSNNYVLDDLEPCKDYEFEVRTHCGGLSTSDWSITQSFSTPCSPVACDPITAINLDSIDYHFFNISWDSLQNASSYLVQFRATGTSDWTSLATLNNGFVTVPNLNSCSAYEMRVQTVCDMGTSIYSDTLMVATACFPCDSITGVAASGVGFQEINLVWSDAANSEGYVLQYAEVGGTWTEVTVQDNFYNLVDLTNCTDYMVRVKNLCVDQLSPWSDTLYVTTQCCLVPDDLAVTQIDYTSAIFSWANASNGLWLVRLVDIAQDSTHFIRTDTNRVELTFLEHCSNYTVEVAGLCTGDTTAWSSVLDFSTLCCSAAIDLAVSDISYTNVNATWAHTGANTTWSVYLQDEIGQTTLVIVDSTDSAQLIDLQPCSTYKVWVDAACGLNVGSVVDTIEFTTECCLPASDLTVVDLGFTDATVTWAHATGANWTITWQGGGVIQSFSGNVNETSFAITDLELCTEYQAWVEYHDCDLPMGASFDTLTFTTECCVTPTFEIDTISYDFATFSFGTGINVDSATVAFTSPNHSGTIDFQFPDPMEFYVNLDSCTQYSFTLLGYCDGNLGSSPSTISVMSLCTSGSNLLMLEDVRLFPNPATNVLNISGSGLPKNLRIFDQWGRLVFESSAVDETGVQIDLSNVAPGTYAVQLFDVRGVYTQFVQVR